MMRLAGRLNKLQRAGGCPECGHGEPRELKVCEIIQVVSTREEAKPEMPPMPQTDRKPSSCPKCGRVLLFMVTHLEVVDDGDNGESA
jgi:hypothetical protein